MDVEIEQLKAGDRTAWNRAFDILYAISLSVCCSTPSALNHQDHEDVAIAAITHVVDYVETVSSFEECKKLVVTISKNHILDLLRQRGTTKAGGGKVESLEAKEGFDASDASQEPPDVLVARAERALIVSLALKQIPEKYRNVVADFYLKGLTQQEIANKRGLKIGSIGVYLKRGLERLRKILKKDELLL